MSRLSPAMVVAGLVIGALALPGVVAADGEHGMDPGFGGGSIELAAGAAVAVLPDGDLVGAAAAEGGALELVRLGPDGVAEASAMLAVPGGVRSVLAATAQPTGHVVVQVGGDAGSALLRVSSELALDGSFGTGGSVALADGRERLAGVQADGRLIVTGYADEVQAGPVIDGGWVRQLTAAGDPDVGFAGGAPVVFPSHPTASHLAIRTFVAAPTPAGGVVVASLADALRVHRVGPEGLFAGTTLLPAAVDHPVSLAVAGDGAALVGFTVEQGGRLASRAPQWVYDRLDAHLALVGPDGAVQFDQVATPLVGSIDGLVLDTSGVALTAGRSRLGAVLDGAGPSVLAQRFDPAARPGWTAQGADVVHARGQVDGVVLLATPGAAPLLVVHERSATRVARLAADAGAPGGPTPAGVTVAPGDGRIVLRTPGHGPRDLVVIVDGAAHELTSDGVVAGFANGSPLTVAVHLEEDGVVGPALALGAVTPELAPGRFHPTAARRLVDTRTGGARLVAGELRPLDLQAMAGAPDDAAALVVNVTAVDADAAGYLRLSPCGVGEPATSNLNYGAGGTAAALTTVLLDGGATCARSWAATDLVVDLVGWYATVGGRSNLAATSRLLDTRGADGLAPRLAPGAAVQVDLAGEPGRVAVVNVTATDAAGAGYVSAFACRSASDPSPGTSTLNTVAGQDVANLAMVATWPIGEDHVRFCVVASTAAHVVVDQVGWIGAPGDETGALFVPVVPRRMLDTRTSTPVEGAAARGVPLVVQADDPVRAGRGALVSVVATRAAGPGWLATGACGRPMATSTLNLHPDQDVANTTWLTAGDHGACVSSSAPTDVVVDLLGWFVP